MKKQMLSLIVIISVSFFMIACSDGKKKDDVTGSDTDEATDSDTDEATGSDTDEATGSDTDEVSDDSADCPVSIPVEHNGEEITAAADWTGIHLVKGTLWVKAPLAMDKCTKVIMDGKASITVADGGSIKVEGTPDHTVLFVSAKAAPSAGDWKHIEIQNTSSSGNSFQFTSFLHGGADDHGVIWIEAEADVAIDNCFFSNIKNYGVAFDIGAIINSFKNNKFASVGTYPVLIGANEVPALSPIVTDNAAGRIHVKAEDIDAAGTWKNLSIGYEVERLYIHKPVTIEPGVTLFMPQDSSITLEDGGSIIAKGAQIAPIVFTSAKEAPGAGDWQGIFIEDTASNDTAFEYVLFEYAGGNDYGAVWTEGNAKVSIKNCNFKSIQNFAVVFESSAKIVSFTDNHFSEVGNYPIFVGANAVPLLSPIITDNNMDGRVKVRSEDVDVVGTWKNLSIGYEVEYLNINKPIVIEAGTTLYMTSSIDIKDGGALALNGTETAHVTITSYKEAPSSGDWAQINIYNTSSNANTFTYTDIMYGGSNDYGQLWVQENAKITLDNVVFSDGKTCDLYDEGDPGQITQTDCTLVECVL